MSCVASVVNALSCRADELEVATITAKGGDVSGEMRQLEDTLGRLCDSFQEAKRLAAGSQEAAAKCQVRFAHVLLSLLLLLNMPESFNSMFVGCCFGLDSLRTRP